MAKRSYRQNCALAHAADVIGERWTLLILRDLLIRPRRYNDLSRSLRGLGTNLLAARLKELEQNGLVEKQTQSGSGHLYALTALGQSLEPALLAMVRWGFTFANRDQGNHHHQDDWDLLALRAAFDPERARGLNVSVAFTGPEEPFRVTLKEGMVEFGFGATDPGEPADATVLGTLAELYQALSRCGWPKTGRLPQAPAIKGSKSKLTAFLKAFVVPPLVP